MNKNIGFLVVALVLILSACSSYSDPNGTEIPSFPTPTFHELFILNHKTQEPDQFGTSPSGTTPTVAAFFTKLSTPTKQPTQTPTPTIVPNILEFPIEDTISKTIYDDNFDPNWRLERGNNINATIRTRDITREGKYAIVATPKEAYSRLNFIITRESTEIYPLDLVLGFRFWINPGDGYLEPDDLVVTVFGSNEYPYYVEGDSSVTSTFDPVFSETRLYYLGFNRSIPPFTWAEVIVWLDDLIYDPYYENVVGFYIKNEEDFLQTFYLDDVRVILASDESLPTRKPD